MKIAVPKERWPGETRVAVTPDTVNKYINHGHSICVEAGAGAHAGISDDAFRTAGAKVVRTYNNVVKNADLVLKLRPPLISGTGNNRVNELAAIPKGAVLAALIDPVQDRNTIDHLAKAGVTAFSMNLMPRITRAQSADVLSSQSNLAGYKAVIDAAAIYARAVPMMMTAAGTIPPARVLVLGAGVAGLQAIATARRLGGVVSAFDVRPAAKEQVESLGATFISVDHKHSAPTETAGGYAQETSKDYRRKQETLIAQALQRTDIAITTALIPGKPAPQLISETMVQAMRPGSVIVDLAVEAGGNCALSQPGKVIQAHGVTIMGYLNVPGRLAADASMLYARNLLAFLTPMMGQDGKLTIDWTDEIITATCLTRNGRKTGAKKTGIKRTGAKKQAQKSKTKGKAKSKTTAPTKKRKQSPAKKKKVTTKTTRTKKDSPS